MKGIPLEAQCLYRRGVELSARMSHEAAVRCLWQAVIIAPRFGGAYHELGRCLEHLGRKGDAEDCYQKSCMMVPGGSSPATPA
jgi:tetratricopeptide (TPR) repeat protein